MRPLLSGKGVSFVDFILLPVADHLPQMALGLLKPTIRFRRFSDEAAAGIGMTKQTQASRLGFSATLSYRQHRQRESGCHDRVAHSEDV